MQEGRLVEEGTHEELAGTYGSVYGKLVALQKKAEEEAKKKSQVWVGTARRNIASYVTALLQHKNVHSHTMSCTRSRPLRLRRVALSSSMPASMVERRPSQVARGRQVCIDMFAEVLLPTPRCTCCYHALLSSQRCRGCRGQEHVGEGHGG